MTGYSGTPLARKLGIKPGHRVLLARAPKGFETHLTPLPDRAVVQRRAAGAFDVILLFAGWRKILDDKLESVAERLGRAGGLWVAWPKKSSGVTTDLSFDRVQKAGLALGLVDNKVCAVDETWSSLRFVTRLKDR